MIRFRRTCIKLRILLSRLAGKPREVVRRHQFNFWAENGWSDSLDESHLPLTEMALQRLQLSSGERVLDVGCGGGFASRLIAAATGKDSTVVGLDISDEMARRARAKSAGFENVRFLCGSAEHVPVRDNFFSAILSVEAFYYVENQQKALQEFLRAMAPGGLLCLVMCLYRDRPGWESEVRKYNLPVRVRSAAEYKRMIEDAGWSEVEVEDCERQRKLGSRKDWHDRALFVLAKKPVVN